MNRIRIKQTVVLTFVLIVVFLSTMLTHSMADTVLLSNFDDGNIIGWTQAGDGGYLKNYNIAPCAQGANGSPFCLRVTMVGTDGWTGVMSPQWTTLPVSNPTALTLNARGSAGSPQMLIDLYTSDGGGSSYWCIFGVPTDGTWQNYQLVPANFFLVAGSGPTQPNLSRTTAICYEIYGIPPMTDVATLDIDEVGFIGYPVSAGGTTPPALSAQSCSGINVLLANTTGLPSLGQDMTAYSSAATILTNAGATVTTVTPGSLNLTPAENRVLVWEGPACSVNDWPAVQTYLDNGGAMLWWGAGLPFGTPVDSNNQIVNQTMNIPLATPDYTNGLMDGWTLECWLNGLYVGSDDEWCNSQVTEYGGQSALKATLSAYSTNPLDYNSDLSLGKSWDATGQSSKFDLSQPVSMVVDFVSPSPTSGAWIIWMTASFADEAGSPSHSTGWIFWPGSTLTFGASDFGVSNKIFASMQNLQICLPAYSATYGQGSYQTASCAMEFTGISLKGYAKSNVATQPATALTEGTFQESNPFDTTYYWKSTTQGQSIWPGFTSSVSLATNNSYYLTTNNSIYLNALWPWVDFNPLMTLTYDASGWCGYTEPYTGSVIALFNYHSGPYTGARVILGTVGNSAQSPLSPSNAMFPQMLTGCVRQLAPAITTNTALDDLPTPPTTVTRSNYFSHPQYVMGGLDWGSADTAAPETVYGIKRLGMNIDCVQIPWLHSLNTDGTACNWAKMDKLVANAEAGGWGIVFDGYPFGYAQYPWTLANSDGLKTEVASIYNSTFTNTFTQTMAAIAARYANNPAVVGLFATPDTGTLGFSAIDTTQTGIVAWNAYCTANSLSNTLPTVPAQGNLDLSQARVNYVNFWSSTAQSFVRGVINAIRAQAPDMPILLRGNYLDAAQSFILASEFEGVEPHCECVETSIDVESYLRGYALTYGVPISAENGWPKERSYALQWTCASNLLGGYNDFYFSFTSTPYAWPGLYQFLDLTNVWPLLKGAAYTTPTVGLMACDTRIWASNPTNWLSCGGPTSGFFMERTGIPFCRISSQWPKLTSLTVLVDDGACNVLNATARTTIANWVRAGGRLIALPTTGQYDAAGSGTSLASALGITFTAGTTKTVGNGKVITVAGAPSDENSTYASAYLSALTSAGAKSPVPITPYVNQAVYSKTGHTYAVVYNKNSNLCGSFFTDIYVPNALAAMSNTNLTVGVPATGAYSATERRTNTALTISNGKVSYTLPVAQWGVIDFATPTWGWSDGFESNNFTTGGWTNSGCTTQSTYKYSGTYAAAFNSSDTLTKTYSTVGKSNIIVKYARYGRSGPSSGHFIADWSTNGSTWTTLEDFTGTSPWTVKQWQLPTGADNQSGFRIRFRVTGYSSLQYAYLDDVSIGGS